MKNYKSILIINKVVITIFILFMLLWYLLFSPVGNYEYVTYEYCNFTTFGYLHEKTHNYWFKIYNFFENLLFVSITYLILVRLINKNKYLKNLKIK